MAAGPDRCSVHLVHMARGSCRAPAVHDREARDRTARFERVTLARFNHPVIDTALGRQDWALLEGSPDKRITG